jgi:signal transduction histidine kinase
LHLARACAEGYSRYQRKQAMNKSNTSPLDWKAHFHQWLGRLIARKWFDVGLRSKMSVLVTVGLTGLIASFALIGITTIRQATQQLLSEHMLRARILAETLDSNLEQVGGLLTILSPQIDLEHPSANLQDWKAVSEEDFRSVQGIYLFDKEANLIAGTVSTPDIDWNNIPAIHMAEADLQRIVSIEGMPRPYALIVVPIMEAGAQTSSGALAAVLDLSNPDIFLSNSSLGLEHNGTFQVLDSEGQILVSSQPGETLSPDTIDKIMNELFVEGQPTVEACLGCTGDELKETGTIIAFAPLKHVPWGVVIWHDSRELFAPIRRLGVQALVLGVLTMTGAFFLVLITTRSVIAPVQMLTDATRKISEGQFDTSTLKSVECTLATSLAAKSSRRRDEIGVLSNSFITMCTRLQLSIEEIQSLNRELDARVHARTRQLSTLNAVALTVNQSLNLKEILDRALDEILQLTGIDMVAIFLLDPLKGNLKLMAFRGLSERAARLAYQVGLLDGSCGGVVELGEPIVVPDISQYRGRGAESLQREHVTAIMHVPLLNKGRVLGSMCLGTHNNTKFDDEEQKLLTAVGNQIAIAVENARLYAEVQHKERVRGELFQKVLAAQEEERKRIARELHDEISQSLTALLYEAEEGLEWENSQKIKKRLQSICDLTQHTLDDVHNLMFDLRPSMLDQLGLIPALRWLAQSRLETKGIRVTIEVTSNMIPPNGATDIQRLSPEMETALFRVVQEAISNIARHAAARNVEIKLELDESSAVMSIQDDGIGFDLSELSVSTIKETESTDSLLSNNTRGLGIVGMQERIELMGGELDINTTPGSGTHIHIRVPIQERSLVHD